MLTVTSKSFHEKIQVENEEVILNGPPDLLSGQITINNLQEEKLSVKELPLQAVGRSIGGNLAQSLQLGLRLKPNETRKENITHRIDPQTPPGVYESSISVGGATTKLKLIVQASIKIDVTPATFTFQGTAPGKAHTTFITLTNNGNMPFQIPDVKHVTMVDMDYLCRATAVAIRSEGASKSYEAMMDELTRNVFKNMTDWLSASIKEAGQVLEPGAKKLVELTLTLPENAHQDRDYSGEIRLWDQVISYTIKSHNLIKPSKK